MSTAQNRSERVVVAIDPHKASWTAAAVDGSLRVLATVRVPVNRVGYRGAASLRRPLAERHMGDRGCHRSGFSVDEAAAHGRSRAGGCAGQTGGSGAAAVDRAWPQER